MATSKNSALPAFIGLLLLALIAGGAYWLLSAEEGGPAKPGPDRPSADKPAAEAPKATPAGQQRDEVKATNPAFDQAVRVKVVDATGQVIPNAQVEVREDVDPLVTIDKLVATYQTRPDGTVEVRGSSKVAYTIAAEAPGHIKVFQPIRAPVREATLELTTGGSLDLTFQDETTKAPVPGVPVKLYAELGGKPNPQYTFVVTKGTDKGSLRLAPVPQVEFTVGVNHPDYDPIDDNYKVAVTENRELLLVLKHRITITGRVVADADGKPIKGVTVMVGEGTAPSVSKSLGFGEGGISRALTDDVGRFQIDKAPVGTLYLDAVHPEFMTESKGPIESDSLKSQPIEFRMKRNAVIRGHVVDADENPVAGAEIVPVFAQNPFFEQQLAEQRKNAIKSGDDGTFEWKQVQPNLEWKIHAFHPSYLDAVSESITLKPGEAREGLVIRMMKGGQISGATRDSAGNPLKGVEVVAVLMTTEKGTQTRQPAVTSGDDGSFLVPGLRPGVYGLEASLEGYCKEMKRGVRYNANEVIVTLAKEGVITGEVLSAADRTPVTEFQVRFRQSGIPVPQTAGMQTVRSKDGKFEVHGLKPAPYDLEVKAKDFAPQIVPAIQVLEGQTSAPVTVLLNLGSSLEGSITQLNHQPVNRALVELDPVSTFDPKDKDYISMRGSSDENGHFVIGKLLPGKYRLTITHPKYAQMKPLDVEVQSGVNRQDVVLQGGATVTVYVRDDKGDPVAGVRVLLRDKARQFMSSPGSRMKVRSDTPFMSVDGGGGPMSRRQTNKDGFIVFRRQDAGEYELMVAGDQYETFRKDMTLEYEKEYVEQVAMKPKGTK